MSGCFDVVVVGAGPAGMAAAIDLRQFGLSVLVVDEQPDAGGQIWRAVERNRNDALFERLGHDYRKGAVLASRLRQSGAELRFSTQVWQIEEGWRVFLSNGGIAEKIETSAVLLATGAQERPNPFPGWTLPGVMSVGAAQIMLKASGQIPAAPVHIAGSGPLPLLYMTQILGLGGRIAAFLDTTPAANRRRAARHLPRALLGWRNLLKGMRWLKGLRDAGIPVMRDVCELEALGSDAVEGIRYRCGDGSQGTLAANLLLVHEGVVPGIHASMALGCKHVWRQDQMSFAPVVDGWGKTSKDGIFVAGDGGGIVGADAAAVRGRIAALGIAAKLGALASGEAARRRTGFDRSLRSLLAIRPFLDALYRPREQIIAPADATVVCRCEEITAGQVREASRSGSAGPNQVKAATRAGMGPCQGRQCGYTISSLLARERDDSIADVGYFNIRPPLKPVTLGELAGLANDG